MMRPSARATAKAPGSPATKKAAAPKKQPAPGGAGSGSDPIPSPRGQPKRAAGAPPSPRDTASKASSPAATNKPATPRGKLSSVTSRYAQPPKAKAAASGSGGSGSAPPSPRGAPGSSRSAAAKKAAAKASPSNSKAERQGAVSAKAEDEFLEAAPNIDLNDQAFETTALGVNGERGSLVKNFEATSFDANRDTMTPEAFEAASADTIGHSVTPEASATPRMSMSDEQKATQESFPIAASLAATESPQALIADLGGTHLGNNSGTPPMPAPVPKPLLRKETAEIRAETEVVVESQPMPAVGVASFPGEGIQPEMRSDAAPGAQFLEAGVGLTAGRDAAGSGSSFEVGTHVTKLDSAGKIKRMERQEAGYDCIRQLEMQRQEIEVRPMDEDSRANLLNGLKAKWEQVNTDYQEVCAENERLREMVERQKLQIEEMTASGRGAPRPEEVAPARSSTVTVDMLNSEQPLVADSALVEPARASVVAAAPQDPVRIANATVPADNTDVGTMQGWSAVVARAGSNFPSQAHVTIVTPNRSPAVDNVTRLSLGSTMSACEEAAAINASKEVPEVTPPWVARQEQEQVKPTSTEELVASAATKLDALRRDQLAMVAEAKMQMAAAVAGTAPATEGAAPAPSLVVPVERFLTGGCPYAPKETTVSVANGVVVNPLVRSGTSSVPVPGTTSGLRPQTMPQHPQVFSHTGPLSGPGQMPFLVQPPMIEPVAVPAHQQPQVLAASGRMTPRCRDRSASPILGMSLQNLPHDASHAQRERPVGSSSSRQVGGGAGAPRADSTATPVRMTVAREGAVFCSPHFATAMHSPRLTRPQMVAPGVPVVPFLPSGVGSPQVPYAPPPPLVPGSPGVPGPPPAMAAVTMAAAAWPNLAPLGPPPDRQTAVFQAQTLGPMRFPSPRPMYPPDAGSFTAAPKPGEAVPCGVLDLTASRVPVVQPPAHQAGAAAKSPRR